jgi:hypothetical protein
MATDDYHNKLAQQQIAVSAQDAMRNMVMPPAQSISLEDIYNHNNMGPLRTSADKARTIFDANISVTEASNGYVVSIARNYGGLKDIFVATTLNEVRDIILAQMAVAKLER